MKIAPLPRTDIDNFLRTQTLARIGCHAGGQIYIVPIAYAPENEEGPVTSVLVHSFEGQKVRMMRENPHVCLEVDEIAGPSSWRTVVIDGEFEELRGSEVRQRALSKLARHLLPPEAASRMARGDDPFRPPGEEAPVVLYRIRIHDASGRVATP
jgi:nitroimidazol reductase NimA-like FMN-containing flavoprotein (pyridoxamine 5'-phosphate oxidase superfamily)